MSLADDTRPENSTLTPDLPGERIGAVVAFIDGAGANHMFLTGVGRRKAVNFPDVGRSFYA